MDLLIDKSIFAFNINLWVDLIFFFCIGSDILKWLRKIFSYNNFKTNDGLIFLRKIKMS